MQITMLSMELERLHGIIDLLLNNIESLKEENGE